MSGIKFNSNDASTVKRVDHLSSILAEYAAEEIHDRLDRLYLEEIEAGASKSGSGLDQQGSSESEAETIAALEEELGSLFPEIEVLAEMSTRQEFQEPILREIQNEHNQLRVVSHQKLEKVCYLCTEHTWTRQIANYHPLYPGPRHNGRHDINQTRIHQKTRAKRLIQRNPRTTRQPLPSRNSHPTRPTALITTRISSTPFPPTRPNALYRT